MNNNNNNKISEKETKLIHLMIQLDRETKGCTGLSFIIQSKDGKFATSTNTKR